MKKCQRMELQGQQINLREVWGADHQLDTEQWGFGHALEGIRVGVAFWSLPVLGLTCK